MYEKTISAENRIYSIHVDSSPTLIYDLLSPADKADYDRIITTGLMVQPLSQYPSFNNDQMRARTPVDGYCYSSASDLYFRTSANGAEDHAYPDERYSIPVYFWPNKMYVSTPSSGEAIIRIFFS